MLPNTNLRVALGEVEKAFKQSTNIPDLKKYRHNQTAYDNVSIALKAILDNTRNYGQAISKRLIFLVGATGAGKSTLINYIAFGDDNFIIKNDDEEITTVRKCIAEIGGKSATTLFPNVYQCDLGVFLDCAGDGDTGGIIVEVINSIIKTQIAKNVEEVKVIFVTPSRALKGSAGYGQAFKNAFDKNSQFMGDINYFKDNIGIVFTSASPKQSALGIAKQSLQNVLKHTDIGNYAGTVKQILSNKYIETFSKPSQSQQKGDTYEPPSWNRNQREKIVAMIQRIPFSRVPKKDFFKTSTSPQVREVMLKALRVVQGKVGNLIQQTISKALPVRIKTVELKPLAKYVNGLALGSQTDLISFIKVLSWNNYLKVNFDEELINKLSQQIAFLTKFTNKKFDGLENSQLGVKVTCNWTKTANLQLIFNDIHGDIQKIIQSQGHNFSKFIKQKFVICQSSSDKIAAQIVPEIQKLHEQYKRHKTLIQLAKQQGSEYYKDQKKKQFSHKEKQAYQDIEKVVEEQQYQEYRPAEWEKSVQTQIKTRQAIKNSFEKYSQPTIEQVQVIKKFDKQKQIQTVGFFKNFLFTVCTAGVGPLVKGLVDDGKFCLTDKKIIEYQDQVKIMQKVVKYIQKERQTFKVVQEQYTQQVQTLKQVSKAGCVKKTRLQLKEKDVTKYRQKDVYKDLNTRQFDQSKFLKQFQLSQIKIASLSSSIEQKIRKYPKGNTKNFERPQIKAKDQHEEKYINLLVKWQNAQYSAYFAQNPSNSLESLSVQTIAAKFGQNNQLNVQKNDQGQEKTQGDNNQSVNDLKKMFDTKIKDKGYNKIRIQRN